ncbi:hypothetical protein BD626DRAFT_489164 [Schizophyllum amplum]|uniref:Uncharacterized protein n=1 Tax=Schizophyllum amplum TaxID=97359 RepID=A0A550CL77_9AGAR|nr:hypothetical protein BD626DRAFT_489164 [Auriculariopsis ampla]
MSGTQDSLALASSSSIVSFEVNDLLDQWNPPVLAESLSIDTLSSSSSVLSIPALPSACIIPPPTIMDLKGGLPISSSSSLEYCKPRLATVTVPTPPRMRAMLKDNMGVGKWLERLRNSSAPGHSPWSECEDTATISWLPEGSVYTPEAFQRALVSARCTPAYQTTLRQTSPGSNTTLDRSPSPTPISPTLKRRMSYHPSSFRDALVFEREISLKSEGGIKRWSMQVPANTMKPELVDIVVELQKLNLFFNDGLSDPDHCVSALDKQKDQVSTPTLTVSDSHETFPLSLEPAKETATTTLIATRRGKKAPPPLNLKRELLDSSYPGIPTAFLGTPSAYHPELDVKPAREGPAMNINDMISSLRSQCAAISRSPTSDAASSPLASVCEEPEEQEEIRTDHLSNILGNSAVDNYDPGCSTIKPATNNDSLMRKMLPEELFDTSLEADAPPSGDTLAHHRLTDSASDYPSGRLTEFDSQRLTESASEHLTESLSDFLREFESDALQPPTMCMPPAGPLPSLPPLESGLPVRDSSSPMLDSPLSVLDASSPAYASSPGSAVLSPGPERALSPPILSPTLRAFSPSPPPGLSSRTGSLRGILKGGKNVRFASLPNRRETSPAAIETFAAGRSTGAPVLTSMLKKPVASPSSPSTSSQSPTSDQFSTSTQPRAARPPLAGRHSTGSAPARQPSPSLRRPSPLRSTFTASSTAIPPMPALPAGVRASTISPAIGRSLSEKVATISPARARAISPSRAMSMSPSRASPSPRLSPSPAKLTPTLTKQARSNRPISMMPSSASPTTPANPVMPVSPARQARASVAISGGGGGVDAGAYTRSARPMTIGAPPKGSGPLKRLPAREENAAESLEGIKRASVAPAGGKENLLSGSKASWSKRGGGQYKDENAARTESASATSGKSRMPVPLRNILTRFK